MQYLLIPLSLQYDKGFGMMGDAFLTAAQELESASKHTFGFHQHLPISFLYRHSIELFLKSAILIFHRRLQLPYDQDTWEGIPKVLVRGKWQRMDIVHSIRNLATYQLQLFETHEEFLKERGKTTWDFPQEFHEWVVTIENHDHQSTYFRYPTTKDSSKDAAKSGIKSTPLDELLKTIQAGDDGGITLLLQDEKGNDVAAFNPTKPLTDVVDALRNMAGLMSGVHVGLRVELCDGN